jgi:hypothetical protein
MDMFDFSCGAAGLFVDIEADDCAAAAARLIQGRDSTTVAP